ncbi:MAG: DUF86 domain-containing protein [Rhodospirillales bacterium]|nr:DUF86 domain-containing protein [Rhodospirillales bacterium]
MDRDLVYLLDILGSAHAIRAYIKGVSRHEFLANPQLQDSIIRRIEIMGEATGRLSAAFCERHPEIPWARIRGMRNRMIHGYEDIDMEIVWDTVERHIPYLIPQLDRLVPPEAE